MHVLKFAVLALVSFASTRGTVRENLRLKKSNGALLKALRSLTSGTERGVGNDCLTEAPAARCDGDTLVTFVNGVAKADGCMVYGRQMEDCAMGSCNAAAGKCDAISSSEAIPCNSIIGHDWACLECHASKGKACRAKAGYGSSDLVNGVCNDAYGCVSPSRETETAVGEWEPVYGGKCKGEEEDKIDLGLCQTKMKKFMGTEMPSCECFNCPDERIMWDLSDWSLAGCCDEGHAFKWDGSCQPTSQEAAVSDYRANSDPNVYCETGYHAVDVPFSWTGGFACGQNCGGGTLTDYHCNCLCVSKANKEAEVGRWEERHDEKSVGGINWVEYGKRMRECPEYNQAACGTKSYCYWSDFTESCRYTGNGVGHAVETKIGNEAYVACSPSYCNDIEQGNCPSSCPKTYWDEISGREWCDC